MALNKRGLRGLLKLQGRAAKKSRSFATLAALDSDNAHAGTFYGFGHDEPCAAGRFCLLK
jgi:hypothetical protein